MKRWRVLAWALGLGGMACGSDASGVPAPQLASEPTPPSASISATAAGSSVHVAAGSGAHATAGSSAHAAVPPAPQSNAGVAGVAGVAGAAGSTVPERTAADGSDSKLPCEVYMALARACHRCHGALPANGAPMSLTTWEDFQRPTIVKPKPPMYEAARMRIDGSRQPLMPPGGAITDADKKTLLDWLNSDAPAADNGTSCS